MSIRLKLLFEFKEKCEAILEQHWSDQTKAEIEARIEDINKEIDSLSKTTLVAA